METSTLDARPTFGSLFAGIGGLDLGLERAGWRCAWQVEIDDYAKRVLAKHWPDVPKWDDVRTFPPAGDWSVDLIAGGFPCQPFSSAGKRRGTNDKRWLWPEFARVIRVLRPRFVFVENVPGLLDRGLRYVLGDLADIGFDAEWQVLPAAAFGAPHARHRVWIVAYAQHPDTHCKRLHRAGADAARQSGKVQPRYEQGRIFGSVGEALPRSILGSWWETEPRVGRLANGVSSRLDRLRGLGNAVVPQVAEWIGRRIIEWSE